MQLAVFYAHLPFLPYSVLLFIPFHFTHWVTYSICLGPVREAVLVSGALSLFRWRRKYRHWTHWSLHKLWAGIHKTSTFTMSLYSNFSTIQITCASRTPPYLRCYWVSYDRTAQLWFSTGCESLAFTALLTLLTSVVTLRGYVFSFWV